MFNNNILLEEFSLFLVHRFKITFGQLSQDGILNSGTVEIPVMKVLENIVYNLMIRESFFNQDPKMHLT